METKPRQPEPQRAASPAGETREHWTTEELAARRRCKVEAILVLCKQHGLPHEEDAEGGYRHPKQLVLAWEAAREMACKYWTTRELAARRRCSVKAIHTLRKQCGLPYEDDPKGYRYAKQAVLAWEAGRARVNEPAPRKLRADARTGLATSGRRRPTSRAQTFGPRPVAMGI